ncbi:helix-turn-helix domain-containing protein [Paenibacillus sp. TAB 01]|uniref:response regulator transcription factor n=1 Tax=Paenibacillus sp. TAB 01 TaxID=3368988 RepID=UPI00375090B6
MLRGCAKDLTVVGMAENAESGLQLIQSESPDAVIVDVCMSGMSGLQMIEQVCAGGLQTEFIVLSGFNEFHFVQRALRLRVNDYLLKPVNRSELVKLLKGIEDRKEVRTAPRQEEEKMEKFSSESRTYLLEQTMLQLMQGSLHLEPRQEKILSYYDVDFHSQFFLMYRMELQPASMTDRIKTPKDKELFVLFCRQVIAEHIHKFGSGVTLLDQDHVPVIILLGNSSTQLLTKQVLELIENIRQVIRSYGKIELSISSSSILKGIENVQVAYAQTMDYNKVNWLECPIKRAMDHMSRHYSDNLNLQTVAKLVHLNSSYLSELFHKRTGVRFSEYLGFIRLEEAAKLLRESKLPVQEIIERVGYQNYRQFNRLFNKQFKATPTEYRKQYWK